MITIREQLEIANKTLAGDRNLYVSDHELEDWHKQLLLDLISGMTMGQSFAEYFDVQDLFLMFGDPPTVQVESHIEKYYR